MPKQVQYFIRFRHRYNLVCGHDPATLSSLLYNNNNNNNNNNKGDFYSAHLPHKVGAQGALQQQATTTTHTHTRTHARTHARTTENRFLNRERIMSVIPVVPISVYLHHVLLPNECVKRLALLNVQEICSANICSKSPAAMASKQGFFGFRRFNPF